MDVFIDHLHSMPPGGHMVPISDLFFDSLNEFDVFYKKWKNEIQLKRDY